MSCLSNYYCRAVRYIQSRSCYSRSLNRDIANESSEVERRARSLRVLDIISSKSGGVSNRQNHFGFVQEFLQTDSRQFRGQAISEDFDLSRTKNGVSSVLEEVMLEDSSSSVKRDGWSFDAYGLSSAVRSCGSNRDFRTGSGFHCLALKGFAQEWRVDICMKLYSEMRNSTSDPNDYTFTALLSACTGSGALGQGRSVHCQTLQMGLKSYLHISNSLISMYCKCGDLKDAFRIFDQFSNKDVVSWNSMIAGYAQYGLATQAIELFELMMPKSGIKPDAITYLGLLSSCRHAGLVIEGRKFFNLMAERGLKPELNHYSCLVDLLGRFGLLQEALELIENMPMKPNSVIWGSLLFSCRVHGDVWMGIRAAEERLILEPECAATHVQLANLYASVGYWKEAATVRKLMKDKGLRTNPGCSWIEIDNNIFMFKAEDGSNCRMLEIVHVLHCLIDHMEFL
ncbi:pentatricopeptide repeat-containing protein At2g37320 isoform X2 [Arabidopsis lyrata subsp. lyrata]|uniref:pentatricopeptide repeat-containing protein At2g37320 isoform X2 n=1 Tax=Arabidopsis lyrata subsp. lyrata TaxID=81972 RepID=UPI000A29C88D|nr:pentatricopeptide repeat-containing protein At2g37320 isoform X2 [Arabidopsis lyrata subsp. lyrata]|eukprot:XP_020883377.1 pentatricopeptide repeat-containing protein At2g37320 isoform X2 [Arabidopsis lyrata subsp. lyrata]